LTFNITALVQRIIGATNAAFITPSIRNVSIFCHERG
jgi:hypothetical protein